MMIITPLDDLRVLECGSGVASAYAAKLLADLGASALKIEPPAGDPLRREGPFPGDIPHPEKSGLFLYLNLNKRGVTIDAATMAGSSLLGSLLEKTDVLMAAYSPAEARALGLEWDKLSARYPRLIVTFVSPFGQTGPWNDYAGDELIGFHSTGFGFEFPNIPADPEAQRPMKGGGHASQFMAGVAAALGTMQALLSRQITGAGQLVDVSVQEALLAVMYERMNRSNAHRPFTRRRADNPSAALLGVLPCADGYIATSPREEHQWASVLNLLGNPEWATDERFATRQSREKNWDAIAERVSEWTRQRSKDEVYRAFQQNRIPTFPVNTAADLEANPQLAYRHFFTQVDHPVAGPLSYPTVPHRSEAMPWEAKRPAPTLGQHNEEVFCRELGYTQAELTQLRQAGVV
jgi:CoA:oxalate CoA-transferase